MREIHPVISLVSFVVLTAFVVLGGLANILIGALLLGFLYIKLDHQAWPAAWRLLRRMRWLFLSIAVIYLWLTPGVPLIPVPVAFAPWLPTVDGLWQGGLRIAALVVIVSAASLLLHVTPREQILAALCWLLMPLGAVGIPHERFAVRAALTLGAVAEVQGQVRGALAAVPAKARPLARIAGVTAAIFAGVMQEAEASPCTAITLPAQSSPSLPQWGIPLLLFAVMAAIRQLGW